MTAFTVGKHQALVPLDSPTRARCIGPDCGEAEQICPRHWSRAYARVEAKHRHDTELVLPGPTLTEGVNALREAVAAQIARAS